MLVWARTDLDKLVLTIESNGTIDPEKLFRRAADLFYNKDLLCSYALKGEEWSALFVEERMRWYHFCATPVAKILNWTFRNMLMFTAEKFH